MERYAQAELERKIIFIRAMWFHGRALLSRVAIRRRREETMPAKNSQCAGEIERTLKSNIQRKGGYLVTEPNNKPVPSSGQPEHTKKSEPTHVLMTERDIELLAELHEHVVLSFSQVHEKLFFGRTLGTAMNRLKRIESQGWIERVRVPRLRLYGRKGAAGVVFQLTAKGRQTLAKARPEMDIFEKCPVLNVFQLDHDLLIADIADHFKGRFPEHRWINGRYLRDLEGLRKTPDAIMLNAISGKAVAIEVELNGKSLRRYREIVANLKSSPRIERVIYVTASSSIGRKIMSAIEGYQVPLGHQLATTYFQFMRLTNCLKVKNKSGASETSRKLALSEAREPGQNNGQTKGPR